jgi:hypothetical protein
MMSRYGASRARGKANKNVRSPMKCDKCHGEKIVFVRIGSDTYDVIGIACPFCAGTGLSLAGLIESEAKAHNESHPGTVRPGVGGKV